MDNRDIIDYRISTRSMLGTLDGGSVLAISTLESAANPRG
jgi:hypothetical protein